MTATQEPDIASAAGAENQGKIQKEIRESKSSIRSAPRIALLTPYSGGNVGDAAIQDALIANIRLRIPGSQFSGISLDNENFLSRHGDSAFPLCATNRPFYSMSGGSSAGQPDKSIENSDQNGAIESSGHSIKQSIRKLPLLGPLLAGILTAAKTLWRESRHTIGAYKFIRAQNMLIVSGGGQLDEEWGGPWGHPFSLYKWGMLARFARIPFVIASVGACKLSSKASRFFVSTALRNAGYRSFRDRNSAAVAATLLHESSAEPVVPDVAFSLAASEFPAPALLEASARNRSVIAISLIAYAKPGSWPHQDRALYDRYLDQMAQVVAQLLSRDCFLIFVRSSRADITVIPELFARLDAPARERLAAQSLVPDISTWQDLLGFLQSADLLIASRLHSVILGFVAAKPSIAISFDPKVDWVMQDLKQTDYLLQIDSFAAGAVIAAVDKIQSQRESIVLHLNDYNQTIRASFESQYNSITDFVSVNRTA